MAYCRFSRSSELYMYKSIHGGYMFHTPNEGILISHPKEALQKLIDLKNSGVKFPDHAIQRLADEIEEEEKLESQKKEDQKP